MSLLFWNYGEEEERQLYKNRLSYPHISLSHPPYRIFSPYFSLNTKNLYFFYNCLPQKVLRIAKKLNCKKYLRKRNTKKNKKKSFKEKAKERSWETERLPKKGEFRVWRLLLKFGVTFFCISSTNFSSALFILVRSLSLSFFCFFWVLLLFV